MGTNNGWVGAEGKAPRLVQVDFGPTSTAKRVDSFLQDRRKARHSWEVSAVNEMLTQMESYRGLFIASTNLIADLDQALTKVGL